MSTAMSIPERMSVSRVQALRFVTRHASDEAAGLPVLRQVL